MDLIRKENWRTFFAFILPFLLFMFYDKFLLRRPYNVGTGDGAESYFAMGLNWLARDPRAVFHHPGYFFQQISAVSFAVLGLPNRGLEAFSAIGVFIHVVTILGVGWWIVRIANRLRLSFWHVASISLFTISTPILAGIANNWHIFFVLSLFTSAAALQLYALSLNQKNSRPEVFGPLFAIGFSLANYFGMLITAATVLAGFLTSLPWRDVKKVRAKLGAEGPWPRAALPALVVAGGVFVHSMLRADVGSYSKYYLVAVLAMAFLIFISAELIVVLIGALALPLLLGWLAGTNVLYRFWFESLHLATAYKGAVVKEDTPTFANFYPYDFLAAYPWFWLVLISCAVSVASLFFWAKNRKKSPGPAREALFVFIAVFTCVALNVISAANVTLVAITPQAAASMSYYPVAIRYFMPSHPAVLICLAWLFRRGDRFITAGTLALVLAVSFLSLERYHLALAKRSAETNELEDHIDRYFNSRPEGRVICLSESPSRICALMAGYHSFYRTASASYKPRASPDGRVIYIFEDQEKESRLLEAAQGDFLLATSLTTKHPSGLPLVKEIFRGTPLLTNGLLLEHREKKEN